MTVTLMPLGDNLVVEHWSSRVVTMLEPTDDPDQVRRTLARQFHTIPLDISKRVSRLVNPSMYGRGQPSQVAVPIRDAEFSFNTPVPGRPDTKGTALVDLPPLEVTATRAQQLRKRTQARPVPPVTKSRIASVVMDDVERATVLAITHFHLAGSTHPELALRAASADYREEIIVTTSGESGPADWWLGRAAAIGMTLPTAHKFAARFDRHGELVLTPRRKQAS